MAASALVLGFTALPQVSTAPPAMASTNTQCGTVAINAIRNSDSTLQRWTDPSPLNPGGFSAADQVGAAATTSASSPSSTPTARCRSRTATGAA